jgi:hypothetical protein
MGDYEWRLADTNIWKVERMLLDHPHRSLKTSDARTTWLRKRYRAFRKKHGALKPLQYDGRERWTDLPAEFVSSRRLGWVE